MKKILFVTREHSAANDLVSRRQDTSKFMILPAHNYQSAALCLDSTRFDLVIINLSLHGLDSFMILSYLLRKHPPIPSIIIFEEKVEGGLPTKKFAGLFHMVEEPVDYDSLFEKIHQNYDHFINEGLAQLTLASFVRLIKISQRSLIMECRHFESSERGVVYFKEGAVVKALCGDLKGIDAYWEIFAWETLDVSVLEFNDYEDIAFSVSNESLVSTPTEETHSSKPVQTPHVSSLPTEAPPSEETTSEGRNEPSSTEEKSPAPLATESDPAPGLVDRVLAAMKDVPNLEGALLVDENGTIKESGGQLTEMMGEKVGHAVRMVFRGSERTIDDLNLEGFQAITLESDDYLIACWPLGEVFLTIMVSRPRSLGLVRLKMAHLLPEL